MEATGTGKKGRIAGEERLLRQAHLAQIGRIPAALFRPQLDRQELGKTHQSLFKRDLGRPALRSRSGRILRLRAACEAR